MKKQNVFDVCLQGRDGVIKIIKCERLQISEFVVGGARPNFLNAYLSLQAFKKLNNKLTNCVSYT